MLLAIINGSVGFNSLLTAPFPSFERYYTDPYNRVFSGVYWVSPSGNLEGKHSLAGGRLDWRVSLSADSTGLKWKDSFVRYRLGAMGFSVGKVDFNKLFLSPFNPFGASVFYSADFIKMNFSLVNIESVRAFPRMGTFFDMQLKSGGLEFSPYLFAAMDVPTGTSELGNFSTDTTVAVVKTTLSGTLKKSFVIDLDQYSILKIWVLRTGETGAYWYLEVRRGQESYTVQPSTSKCGVFTYDIKGITGWKGTTGVEIVFGIFDSQDDIRTNPVVIKEFYMISSNGERGWDFEYFSGWETNEVDVEVVKIGELYNRLPYQLVPDKRLFSGLEIGFSMGNLRTSANLLWDTSGPLVFCSRFSHKIFGFKLSANVSYSKSVEKIYDFMFSKPDSFEIKDEWGWFTYGGGATINKINVIPAEQGILLDGSGSIEFYVQNLSLKDFPFLIIDIESGTRNTNSSWKLKISDGEREILIYDGGATGILCFDLYSLAEKQGLSLEGKYTFTIEKASHPMVLKGLSLSKFPADELGWCKRGLAADFGIEGTWFLSPFFKGGLDAYGKHFCLGLNYKLKNYRISVRAGALQGRLVGNSEKIVLLNSAWSKDFNFYVLGLANFKSALLDLNAEAGFVSQKLCGYASVRFEPIKGVELFSRLNWAGNFAGEAGVCLRSSFSFSAGRFDLSYKYTFLKPFFGSLLGWTSWQNMEEASVTFTPAGVFSASSVFVKLVRFGDVFVFRSKISLNMHF